jgi:hypothetical protein
MRSWQHVRSVPSPSAYYPGLAIRRRLAMKIAHTNRPEGRGYVQVFSQLMRDDGIDTRDKSAMTAFTAVLWWATSPSVQSFCAKSARR